MHQRGTWAATPEQRRAAKKPTPVEPAENRRIRELMANGTAGRRGVVESSPLKRAFG